MSTATSFSKTKGMPKNASVFFIVNGLYMVGQLLVMSNLVLYGTKELGMTSSHATVVYGVAWAASTLFGFIPGWAMSKIGYKEAIYVTFAMQLTAFILLTLKGVTYFYLGLGFYMGGAMFFLPAIACLLSDLFEKQDGRKHSAFILNYALMNIGAFLGTTLSGYLSQISYEYIFYIGIGIQVITALFTFFTLPRIQFQTHSQTHDLDQRSSAKKTLHLVLSFFMAIAFSFLLYYVISNATSLDLYIVILMGLIYAGVIVFAFLKFKGLERKKLLVFITILIFSLAFWTLYNLAPSTLALFIRNNVHRVILGDEISTQFYLALNPFIISVFGPMLSYFLLYLAKQRNIHLNAVLKFSISLVLMGLGYMIFKPAISLSNFALVGTGWIVVSYFLQSIGELFIGPIGAAAVGDFVPKKIESFMMTLWYANTGASGSIVGLLAASTNLPKNTPLKTSDEIFSHAFFLYGSIALILGIILFICYPYLKKTGDLPSFRGWKDAKLPE